MSNLYVLFEHASGYSLFRVSEFEEIGALIAQVEQTVLDLSKFNSVVKLIAFAPFTSGLNALDNLNSISEGVLHDDLKLFLDTNLPKKSSASKKGSDSAAKLQLGVSDSKISSTINESLGVLCTHVGAVPEIIRGIRQHFPNLVKGLTDKSQSKAQLGLGHAYSRTKVKFNVNRVDNMIIQAINLVDQMDKDVNTFSMRIREWYGYHFPELVKIVPDNHTYAKVVKIVKDRKVLFDAAEKSDEILVQLEECVMDSAKAKAIIDASKASMGMDISPIDLINIQMFATRVIDMYDYRKRLHEYLHSKIEQVAPNLSSLIGDQVAARLISHAGSLTNLAKYPASTIQILGAEKALFRALKTKSNTPKYGLIFHSTFIGRAASSNKGRISRYLANKCAIASRIDCFTDVPTRVFGETLKNQVEDRLKFYDSGTLPPKNAVVMAGAVLKAEEVKNELIKKDKKKKKKAKKEKETAAADDDGATAATAVVVTNGKKQNGIEVETPMEAMDIQDEAEESAPKKKKKKKNKDNE
jgi:RNA processing factor Prp31